MIWHNHYGFIATGPHSLTQAYLAYSCAAIACLIKYILQSLYVARQESLLPSHSQTLRQIFHAIGEPPQPIIPPLLNQKLVTAKQILTALDLAGKETVRLGLVDSFFGNISVLSPDRNILYISRSGAPLDQLQNNIDPCALDNTSCAGITASSEFSAHRQVLLETGDRCLLHGHPPFTIIVSMFCSKFPACPNAETCHIDCREDRDFYNIPIVGGEVGTGPHGLCHTLPPAMQKHPAVIVYGHGIFLRHSQNFAEPINSMRRVEIAARNHIMQELRIAP